MSSLAGIQAVMKKDMRVYYLKGPVLIFGLFFPACLFCAFVIGRHMPAHELVPGLIAMALFFTASATTPAIMPFEMRTHTLERLLIAPLSISSMLIGDVAAAFLYGLFMSIVPILISVFVIGAPIVHPFILIVTVVLGAVCFAVLGTLFAVPVTDVPSDVMMISNLVRLPMIFFSGVFIPIGQISVWGRGLSAISPLTYCTELIRYSTIGGNFLSPALCLAVLAGFTVALWLLSTTLHHRNMSRRLAL